MLKNLKASNMQIVGGNKHFKLIRVSEENKANLKPLVLINGQMEHHIQAIETATKLTYPWCYQYSGYYQYDDELHTPYIFLYDYPIYGVDRTKIDLDAFATGLVTMLKDLNLSSVDIMGQSCGGMIGTLASKSELVDKVVAMHSPIYGTPLLQRDWYLQKKKHMELDEKILFELIGLMVDFNFGYMQNNKQGFKDIREAGDIDKITFTASDVSFGRCKNVLGNKLAETIYLHYGLASDGVVTYDYNRMVEDGINFIDEDSISHFDIGANKSYTNQYYSRVLAKK